MSFKEIGELHLDTVMKTGLIQPRNQQHKKRSLLYPDSDNLIYMYTSTPHIRDSAYFKADETHKERILFIGKDIFTIYDGDTGNFYNENPKYILKSLRNQIGDDGLQLTDEDLTAVCINLRYAVALGEWAYIISYNASNKAVFFKYNIYSGNTKSIAYSDFSTTIGLSFLYCKMVVYNDSIYFFSKIDGRITVYQYNTFQDVFYIDETITNGLDSLNADTTADENTLIAFVDPAVKKLYVIACLDTHAVKVFDFNTLTFETIVNKQLNFANTKFIQGFCNSSNTTVCLPNEYIVLVTGNDMITWLSTNSSDFYISRIHLANIYGITGIIRSKEPGQSAHYLILHNREDGTSAMTVVNASSISGQNDTVEGGSERHPFLEVLSNKIILGGFYNIDAINLNLVYGSYIESGMGRPLIKQMADITINGSKKPYFTRGNLEDSSQIVIVDGVSYGTTQMARLHLVPEQIEEEPEDAAGEVFLRESPSDLAPFTTGEYLWKHLYKIGLPFNTHVKTVGRIIIDGYVIPISETLITKAADSQSYGDILLTFDKHFNSNSIEGALQENITQYPGILFYKNNGFISDAVISSGYESEGSLAYSDSLKGNLFSPGLHSILASVLIDKTLLLAGPYGSIASINIETMGYTNIKGERYGENPPLYYRQPDNQYSLYPQTPDNIKGMFYRKNKIFFLTNRGYLYRTVAGENNWALAVETNDYLTAQNPIHYGNNASLRSYCISDNLLLISWPFGSISSFDLDSEVYTGITDASLIPKTVYTGGGYIGAEKLQTVSSLTLGTRIYFVGIDSVKPNSRTLCWFDTKTNAFGYAKNTPNDFTSYTSYDLTTDGEDIYLMSSRETAAVFYKYSIKTGSFSLLPDTQYAYSHCGIYYYKDRIYSLFGINAAEKYIMVYSISGNKWFYYRVSQSGMPDIYFAKGFLYKNINPLTGFDSTGIYLLWGIDSFDREGAVAYSNILRIQLENISSLSDAVFIEENLDTLFNNTRLTGYSLTYDTIRNIVYITGGKNSGGAVYNTRVYRFDINTKTVLDTVDTDKPYTAVWHAYGMIGQYLYDIGGSNEEGVELICAYDTRANKWEAVKSLAYDAGAQISNDKIPIITAMHVITSIHTVVICYADGSIASINLHTGEMILPNETKPRSISCIYAQTGELSKTGVYHIYEDEEDVVFTYIGGSFKFAKKIGVFFKAAARDSRNVTFSVQSERPFPTAGASQVAIGKYIVFLNGYDHTAANWQTTIHNNIFVLDTATGEYAVIGKTIGFRYNAYSYYYNGYIYTFGGIYRYEEMNIENTVHYVRRALIERFDLVLGTQTEDAAGINPVFITSLFGIELHNTALKNIGKNQIVYVNPTRLFKNNEKRYIISAITGNETSNNPDADIIRQWFVFDLATEQAVEASEILPPLEIDSNSVLLVCERDKTKSLYGFQFHSSSVNDPVNTNTYVELRIIEYSGDGGERIVVDRVNLASPLKWQGYAAGLTNIIYDGITDTFIIPCLQKNTSIVSNKNHISTTVSYIFNPEDNSVKEFTRDVINPIKLLNPICSIPFDQLQITDLQQNNHVSLYPVHIINNSYTIVNPINETMIQYTYDELFGRIPYPIDTQPLTEWDIGRKALYTLFTAIDTPVSAAQNVKPQKDPFVHKSGQFLYRTCIISKNTDAAICAVMNDAGLYTVDFNRDALFFVMKYDILNHDFDIVYQEVITDGVLINYIPYANPSGLVNDILWTFIYNFGINTNKRICISYDINKNTASRHRIIDTQTVSNYDINYNKCLPRCIVDEERDAIYCIMLYRQSTGEAFKAYIQHFKNLTSIMAASPTAIEGKQTVFDTEINHETYSSVSIPVNGYIFDKNALYLDALGPSNGFMTKTIGISLHIVLSHDGDALIINTDIEGITVPSIYINDSVLFSSFKNGFIQDIVGYTYEEKEGKKIVYPIVAFDTNDILYNSKNLGYIQGRSFITLDRTMADIPKNMFALPVPDSITASLIIPQQDTIYYFDINRHNIPLVYEIKTTNEFRYTHLRKYGYIPSSKSNSLEPVTHTATEILTNDKALIMTQSNSLQGPSVYYAHLNKRFFSIVNCFQYLGTEKLIENGTCLYIKNRLFYIGTINNKLMVYEFNMESGIIIKSHVLVREYTFNLIKAVYNIYEDCIYILGGILDDGADELIYTFNINTQALEIYPVNIPSDFPVLNVYYHEILNKTFIETASDEDYTVFIHVLDHAKKEITTIPVSTGESENPLFAKTYDNLYVLLSELLNNTERHNRTFDLNTESFVSNSSYKIQGNEDLQNIRPYEFIPFKDKSVMTGLRYKSSNNGDAVYESDFNTEVWGVHGGILTVTEGKLRLEITENLDAHNIYIESGFDNSIKQGTLICRFQGEYTLIDYPFSIIYNDGTEEYIQKKDMGNDTYSAAVSNIPEKTIEKIRIYPSYSVIPGRIVFITSITILNETNKFKSYPLWAAGLPYLINASSAPLDAAFTSKRIFYYKNDFYCYGITNSNEIHKYNRERREFEIFDMTMDTQTSDINPNHLISIKVYLDDTVRFCFLKPTTSGQIAFIFLHYNMISKSIIEKKIISASFPMNEVNKYNILSLSTKPLWISRYFICVLTAAQTIPAGYTNNYLFKVDITAGTASGIDVTRNISPKATLDWWYDRIISFGGTREIYNGNNNNNAHDINFQVSTFRLDIPEIGNTVTKLPLPMDEQYPEYKKSIFISVKSGKILASMYLAAGRYDEFTKQRYSVTTNDIYTLQETEGNYMNYLDQLMSLDSLEDASFLTTASLESLDATALSLDNNHITAFHIPYKDNKLLVGITDKLTDLTAHRVTGLRIISLLPDLIGTCKIYNYMVFIYSGVTQDSIKLYDYAAKKLINELIVERDSETVITHIIKFEENKIYLFYDNGPYISSVIIYNDGGITFKRYDNKSFGRKIDYRSNAHTIQEIDLTFLFDVEFSEYENRAETV
jgi:hypothetical protein